MSVHASRDPVGQDAVLAELRALGERVGALSDEVRRLGGQPALPAAPEPPAAGPVSYAWMAEVRQARRHSATVPRFLLEAGFLVAAAVLAAAAELEPVQIVAVMAGAWALVALFELLASRAARRDEMLSIVQPVVRTAEPADPAWFSPPVEHTLLDQPGPPESDTAITRLPPLPDAESTAERRPGA